MTLELLSLHYELREQPQERAVGLELSLFSEAIVVGAAGAGVPEARYC